MLPEDRPDRPLRVLLVTGGHRCDLAALLALVDDQARRRGWLWAHAVQPAVSAWLTEDADPGWDVLLCHDLPGLSLHRGEPPHPTGPSPEVVAALDRIRERGVGIVATHHSLAGWPGWDGWSNWLGGRFLYAPGRPNGVDTPSSGTRITSYTARVVAPQHPVCDGIDTFTLTDELYLCPVDTDRVVPLLRHDASTDAGLFTSTYEHVLVGSDAAPRCAGAPASDLLAWASRSGASPVVYVQPGDSGETFAVPGYRQLIGNAVDWVASAGARAWAAQGSQA